MGDRKWISYVKKIRPYNILKGIRYLRHFGWKEFRIRLAERMEPEEVPYGPWYEDYRVKPEELKQQKKRRWKQEICFSIAVPVYRTPETFLRQMIESVTGQSYGNWELCIANGSPDDKKVRAVLEEYAGRDLRIRVKNLENQGIAGNSNAALAMAREITWAFWITMICWRPTRCTKRPLI